MKEIVEHIKGKATEAVANAASGYLGRNDVEAMKSLKRSMEILTRQARDVEDEVEKEEMSCKKKRKSEVESWLKEVNDLQPECHDLEAKVSNSRLSLIGDPVGKMHCLVNKLTEQRNNFNGLLLDDFDNNGVPCLPTKLFGNKILETFKKIWPCLVVDNISSIGIWGMGGVGKTTLAKHIKFELEQKNYRVSWVTVSQEFSVTSLQDKIAHVLGIKLSNKDEEHARANILRAAFDRMQKSVLMLDDVWEEFSLEEVGITVAANRCRLILTTRSQLVCDRMLCGRKFMVQPLDEDESWGLFKRTLGDATILSAEVEKIAKSVANRCAGLPIGIVTTAASTRGVTDIREWNIVLDQLKSSSDGYHEMEDEVFPILELSFNRLRGCERLCFLYCCLYPEDHEIEREELIDLFIYAELIPRRDTMELERSDGHRILNKLVKVCLLEEVKNGRGYECVRMHDLIRDMALRITSGRYNSKNAQGVPRLLVISSNHLIKELKDDLAAVSLMASFFHGSDDILELPPLMSPKSLSTLIINGANIREIPDSFLQHMCGLKVLNLGWCRGLRLLPNCISDMVNLTALLLEGCWCLESLPPLGKLKKLRTLNLMGTKVDDVPQGSEELVNLERLYMGKRRWTLPPESVPARVRVGERDRARDHVGERERERAVARARARERARAVAHERAVARARARARERARERERSHALASANANARQLLPESGRALARALPEGTFSKLHRLLQHLVVPVAVHISDLRVLNNLQLFVGGLTYDQFSKFKWWPTHFKMNIFDLDPNDSFGRGFDFYQGINEVADCWRHIWDNELVFEGCNFEKGLDVVLPPGNLHTLKLDSCSGLLDVFSHHWIDKSKDLYNLFLHHLEELMFVLNLSSPNDDDEGVASNREGALRNLRVICLWNLPNLVGLINIGRVSVESLIPPGTFCALEELYIDKCHGLKKLFSVQLARQCLQNLKDLEVCDCDQLEEIVADKDDHDLNGGGEAIISLPSSTGPIASTSQELLLPKLQHLILHFLPELENVCSPTIKIGGDVPTRFTLYDCPKLKRLPSFSSTKISYYIWGKKEW